MKNIIIASVVFASACSSLPVPHGAKLEDLKSPGGDYKIGRVLIPSDGFEAYRHTNICWIVQKSLGECRSIFPSPDEKSALFQVAHSGDIIYHKKIGTSTVVLKSPGYDLRRVEWVGAHAKLYFMDRNAHIHERQIALPGSGT